MASLAHRVLPLVFLWALTAPTLVAPPAPEQDLSALRTRARAIADQVTALERRLESLRQERVRLRADIEREAAALALLELEIASLEKIRARASARYVGRAVEAYKAGAPGNEVAILLSARSLNELLTFARAARRAGALDARAIEEVASGAARARAVQERIDRRKQRLVIAEARAEAVGSEIAGSLAKRRASFESLNVEIRRLEEEIQRKTQAAARAPATRPVRPPDPGLLQTLAGAGPSLRIPDGFTSTEVGFEGLASWYGPGFEGKRTASGDVFDPRLFTAASKELALGTWLYVTYGGRGVVVRVNDRGPYVGSRVLDLSKAAASALGLVSRGVGWVRAEILVKA